MGKMLRLNVYVCQKVPKIFVTPAFFFSGMMIAVMIATEMTTTATAKAIITVRMMITTTGIREKRKYLERNSKRITHLTHKNMIYYYEAYYLLNAMYVIITLPL